MAGFIGIQAGRTAQISRLLVGGGLTCTIVFSALIVLTQALTFDEPYFARLRAFLLSDQCASPCFMGIHPGITTRDQAISLLKVHDWVRRVQTSPFVVSWSWQPAVAEYVDVRTVNLFPAWLITDTQGVVQQISVVTHIAFSDAWIVLGRPDTGEIANHPTGLMPSRFGSFVQTISYRQNALQLRSAFACREDFWQAPVTLTWLPTATTYYPYRLPTYFRVTC